MKARITEEKLRDFELRLTEMDHAAGTVEKYLRDTRKFSAWLDGREIAQDTLVAFKHHLIEAGYQPVTVNGILSAVNTYCKLSGIQAHVNFLRIQKRLFRDEAKDLTENEYDRLLSAAKSSGNLRLGMIIETIASTGIRVSELQYITVEAIQAGMAQIRMKGKVREILLPGKLCKKLRRYARKKKITSGEIFVTKGGRGMSRKQIWAEMKRLAVNAGVDPQKIFPHNLRHLFARVFYRVTKNLVKLSSLLGHSSIDTTRIYLQTSVKEHRSDLEKTGLILLR